jgi:hypothetical protein
MKEVCSGRKVRKEEERKGGEADEGQEWVGVGGGEGRGRVGRVDGHSRTRSGLER